MREHVHWEASAETAACSRGSYQHGAERLHLSRQSSDKSLDCSALSFRCVRGIRGDCFFTRIRSAQTCARKTNPHIEELLFGGTPGENVNINMWLQEMYTSRHSHAHSEQEGNIHYSLFHKHYPSVTQNITSDLTTRRENQALSLRGMKKKKREKSNTISIINISKSAGLQSNNCRRNRLLSRPIKPEETLDRCVIHPFILSTGKSMRCRCA